MPVITITGLQLGSLIAFAIVTETVFQWPGMGLLFVQAVQFADIPVMAAYLIFVGLRLRGRSTSSSTCSISRVDPRLRGERRDGDGDDDARSPQPTARRAAAGPPAGSRRLRDSDLV